MTRSTIDDNGAFKQNRFCSLVRASHPSFFCSHAGNDPALRPTGRIGDASATSVSSSSVSVAAWRRSTHCKITATTMWPLSPRNC